MLENCLTPSCPEPEIAIIPKDGCCQPNPCGIDYEDILCGIQNLMPRGKAWDDCCGDGDRAKLLQIIARRMHEWISEGLCCVSEEFDPCTSEKTIDCWAELYGIPDDCINLDDIPEPQRSQAVKALICAFERFQFSSIPNACFFQDIASILGIEIQIFAPGIVNETDSCCFFSTPSRALPKPCSNDCGGIYSVPTSCAKIAPVVFFKLITEEEPIHLDCPMSNTPLCRFPLTDLMRCIIERYTPIHLFTCII